MDHARDLLSQGRRELARMRLDRAEALFQEALDLDPRLAGAWFGSGRVAFEQARYGDAERKVGQALRHRPGKPKYRNFLGQILLTQGRRAEAIAQWKQVLSKHPGNVEAKRLLKAAGVDGE